VSALSEESDWLTSSLSELKRLDVSGKFERIGVVENCGDGIASVSGLPGAQLGGLIRIGDDGLALAFSLAKDVAGCVLLSSGAAVSAGMRAVDLGEVARVPAGEALLGRVLDPLGRPLDGGDAVKAERSDPVERPAPPIIDRDFVCEPLATGLTVIDAMIPLGRGQRQLIIGDRKTGKTAIGVDAILNQRDTDVISIYAAIGQKDSTIARVIETVRRHGAPERCIFVVGEADSPPGLQWLAPYAACTMAEYFRDRGRHALLVIDDLTKHAAVYRELSLLLRRPPGREAYPGDVFYIHSRLLERAAKLSPAKGKGSLTALPIAETQAGNLSAYIPTNLISITDGQIYLEPKLFYEGHKPAVNVGLSVSRVGAKAQPPVLKDLARNLRLAYAQFLELEVFMRFGAIVDERTRQTIEHGRRIRAVLSQPDNAPLSLVEQSALLLAIGEKLLDPLPLTTVASLQKELRTSLKSEIPDVSDRINKIGALDDKDRASLLAHVKQTLASLAQGAVEEHRKHGAADPT
jgi:F-type H+/Na+-transporting ATPase subunit alpha